AARGEPRGDRGGAGTHACGQPGRFSAGFQRRHAKRLVVRRTDGGIERAEVSQVMRRFEPERKISMSVLFGARPAPRSGASRCVTRPPGSASWPAPPMSGSLQRLLVDSHKVYIEGLGRAAQAMVSVNTIVQWI